MMQITHTAACKCVLSKLLLKGLKEGEWGPVFKTEAS